MRRALRLAKGVSRVAALALARACVQGAPSQADPGAATAPAGPPPQVVEWVYDGALQPRWFDFGYAPHGPPGPGPQLLDLSGHGGWILATRTGEWEKLGDLVFSYQANASFGDFFDVKLDAGDATAFPAVKVTAARRAPREGWYDVRLPMAELNPEDLPFDRFRFRATSRVSKDWVKFDRIGFLAHPPRAPKPPPPAAAVALAVDCRAKGYPISPWIFGIASSHKLDAPYAGLGATAGRWGGNTSSRYNWELGSAWNAGVDWYFKNVNYGRDGFSWRDELAYNRSQGVKTAFSLPMVGWVAKDTRSCSFPVTDFGRQQSADGNAGNGLRPDGKTPLTPGPPTRTSVAAPPEWSARWVSAIREEERARGASSVLLYFLDNEPGLWSDTHRDVHPQPLTYDELLAKTIALGTAVRKAAPDALIAGPTEWGWSGYLYSAADLASGWRLRPDARAHGDVPLLPWYLRQLAAYQKRTGVRVLDVLDVHYYPQGQGIGLGEGGKTDAKTNALRLRSTRSLWDPTYVDESWIGESVELIPRLQRWSAENLPGLRISIGEYNWGAETHISGGLALAEVLGRFAQQEVFSAFYWRYPAPDTPAWHAFRAWRNYDGQGAKVPEWYVPTRMAPGVSLFAARDAASTRLVLVALNLDPARPAKATIALEGCAAPQPTRAFVYTGGPRGLEPAPAPALGAAGLEQELPPYSITVLELQTGKGAPEGLGTGP